MLSRQLNPTTIAPIYPAQLVVDGEAFFKVADRLAQSAADLWQRKMGDNRDVVD